MIEITKKDVSPELWMRLSKECRFVPDVIHISVAGSTVLPSERKQPQAE